MAGYVPKRKVYELTFEAHPGLEVRACSVSTNAMLEFAKMSESARRGIDAMETLFAEFADQALRSWNLEEEDGTPIPANLAGLLAQEPDFVFEIIDAWSDIITGVDENLGVPSQDGKPSPVASIPMEVLSPSQAS